MAAAYPLAWRERARDLALAGWEPQRIALELAASARTVRHWLRQWRHTGTLEIGRSPSRSRLIGPSDEPALAAQFRCGKLPPVFGSAPRRCVAPPSGLAGRDNASQPDAHRNL